MTGIRMDLDARNALDAIQQVAARTGDPAPLLRDIGEYLMIAHRERFIAQKSPDGTPWQPLAPRYQKNKRKNANRILYLDGFLANTLRYQLSGNELLFGSNRPYAAIHHFGGEVSVGARTSTLNFRKQGNKQLFAKPGKNTQARSVSVGAYKFTMPARPWLGTSADDNNEIARLAIDYLQSRL